MKKPKKKTISQLKKQADKIFSDYIRQRDVGVCFTCGTMKEWKYQQNGHYMSRSHLNTRYDETNCHCQCVACNVFKSGNMPLYAIRLQNKYGEGVLKELFRKAHTIVKNSRQFYNQVIQFYQDKL